MSIFKNYDPGRLIVTFKGVLIQGYMDGSFVKVSRAEDAFNTQVGAHGDITRVRNRNRTGMVVVTLQAASPTNDSLSAIALQDELFGISFGPLMVKDSNGTTLAQATHAWIKKLPDAEFAIDASAREWNFECAELNLFVGGALV